MATTEERPGPRTRAAAASAPLRKLQLEDKRSLPKDGGTEEARLAMITPGKVPAPEQGRQVTQTSQPEKTQGIKEGRGLRTEEGQGDSGKLEARGRVVPWRSGRDSKSGSESVKKCTR